jgi:hypothetical protein
VSNELNFNKIIIMGRKIIIFTNRKNDRLHTKWKFCALWVR